MSDRIAAIRGMLEKSPGDTFLHYSLAMELSAGGDHDAALEHFGKCMELDAQYLAAYVEAGKTLRSAGRFDDARQMFRRGLDVAHNKGEKHTFDYITQQIEGLPRP